MPRRTVIPPPAPRLSAPAALLLLLAAAHASSAAGHAATPAPGFEIGAPAHPGPAEARVPAWQLNGTLGHRQPWGRRTKELREPLWKGMSKSKGRHRRGVLLWAHGRSATDAYCGALKKSAHFEYCNGVKEGFKRRIDRGGKIDKMASHVLTTEALKACAERNEMLTHIKPSKHLATKAGGEAIDTPEKLMEIAGKVGYEVIVAVYRSNALARAVSAWELITKRHHRSKTKLEKRERNRKVRERFCGKSLINLFKEMKEIWERGVAAARARNLEVIVLNFDNVTQGIGAAVERTTRVLEPSICGGSKCTYQEFASQHTQSSHQRWTLEHRTSGEAAKCITDALKDDPDYAWMLDLSRSEK